MQILKTRYRIGKSIFILWMLSTGLAFADSAPRPIAPRNGAVLASNMPTLVWSQTRADSFLVEVDGHILDRLSGAKDRTVVFPLSFGKHAWRVIALDKGQRLAGPISTFTVEDKPAGDVPPGALHLRDAWQMQSVIFAGSDGAAISTANFSTQNWYDTSVPVTVLSALVRNGVYPNPYIGKNNLLIPDLNDSFNVQLDLLKYSHIPGQNPWKRPYWFRKIFQVPASMNGQQLILQLIEINYKAEIWLNGIQLADTAAAKGMERRLIYRVTDHIHFQGDNILAVAIYPFDYPGLPDLPPLEVSSDPGINMGVDGFISRNYTKWDAVGWDWQPAIRDRDMGITDEVFLLATGPVELRDPYMAAYLPYPDTSFAYLRTAVTLLNHTTVAQKGVFKTTIQAIGYPDAPVQFEIPFSLAPWETREISLTPTEVAALVLQNPRIWWPLNWGKPNRYQFTMTAELEGKISHTVSDVFGIRSVNTYMGNNERVYRINERDIFLKGGNWVIDMMLNWTASRYEHEMRLSALSQLNIQRIWGPTGVPPKALFRAADSLGILIWQDFLNDFWGTYKNNPTLKPPQQLFYDCTVEIVKKLRNHPSLVIWCGGNEGPNQYESLIMHQILPSYDPWGGRRYQRISNGDGLHGNGPYETLRPRQYFYHGQLTGFSSEIGPSGVPVLSSLKKFLPELGKQWTKDLFPLYGDWGYHDANDRGPNETRRFNFYDDIVRKDYGAPTSFDLSGAADYAAKAQLVNYDAYRAAIEAVNKQLWTSSSGILLWKFNAAWPSLTWQLFDWYLAANAGFYAVQKACEPIHVQWNRNSETVSIVHTGLKNLNSAKLHATIWNNTSKKIWEKIDPVSVKANQAYETGWKLPESKALEFVLLRLVDSVGVEISRNVYWRHPENNFTELQTLPKVTLNVKASVLNTRTQTVVTATVQNASSQIAFFADLNIVGAESREPVVPLFASDNYFILMPGEARTFRLAYDSRDLGEKPLLIWSGVNVTAGETALNFK